MVVVKRSDGGGVVAERERDRPLHQGERRYGCRAAPSSASPRTSSQCNRLGERPDLIYYLPIAQFGSQNRRRCSSACGATLAAASEAMRRDLQREMPGASYVTVTPFDSRLAPQMRSWRLGATMFAIVRRAGARARGDWSVQRDRLQRHAADARDGSAHRARRARADVVTMIVRDALGVVIPGVGIGSALALVGRPLARAAACSRCPRRIHSSISR